MGGFRNDLHAAQHRIERLEAQLDRIEEQRASLQERLAERDFRPRVQARWVAPLVLLIVLLGGGSVFVFSGDEQDAPSDEHDAPSDETNPAEASSETRRSSEPPLPLAAIIPGVEVTERSTRMSGDAVFYGQYWRARVESDASGRFEVGDECIVELAAGLHNGAGTATVRCGDVVLHRTAVSPPERGDEDAGFCHFRETGQLHCRPAGVNHRRGCWLSTAGHRATCEGDVDLYITSGMRDPNVRRPPSIGS